MSAAGGRVRVFLAGEGANELGGRHGHPSYQSDDRPGALSALLSRVQADGWEVGGAREWKRIRKFRAGKADHEDTHNVLGAALDAKEAGCEVLAFSRDQDRDERRGAAVAEGTRRAEVKFGDSPAVIGGVAVPTLEGWILAILGVRGTPQMSPKRASEELAQRGVAPKDGAAMVAIIEAADLDAIAVDAVTLAAWVARARAVLPAKVAVHAART